ncbi:hypothetical protein [Fontivita pretiosa]|uniref:hypothetical protein n=1 Tax=Fontivita pretiosa TaxID=2989684 RepID=UPI003D1865E4
MIDLHDLRERRVDQFARYLKLMHHRALIERHGRSFIIFNEDSSENRDDPQHLEAAQDLVLVLADDSALSATDEEICGGTRVTVPSQQEVDPIGPDGPHLRYVQFAFEPKWFCLDLPKQTLSKPEAARILRDRSGFFWLRDHPEFRIKGEGDEVDYFDCFRKVYVHGDARCAAEDAAYIFFDLWKFPLDWRFCVTASTFNGRVHFERDRPMA